MFRHWFMIHSTIKLILKLLANYHIEERFKCLVRGGVVHSGKIRIALSDIGFDRIYQALESAERGIDTYKDHHKD